MNVRASRRLRLAIVLGALLLVAAGYGLAKLVSSSTRTTPTATSRAAGSTGLLHSLRLAGTFRSPAGYPFALSLVSSLQTADPKVSYQALDSPVQRPAPHMVGVYSTQHSVWLRTLGHGQTVIELRGVTRGSGVTAYGPYVVSPASAADGNFTSPLSDVWIVHQGSIARVARDTHTYLSPPASLRVAGSGSRGAVPTTVTQPLGGNAIAARGTVYNVTLMVKASRLSRALDVEVKLTYVGGSYQFFEAAARKSSSFGIPAGSSRGWIPIELSAVAAKPVRSATLFAVDTGTAPLRGSAWIDNIDASYGR